jgi:predicted nucleotidyltransferase
MSSEEPTMSEPTLEQDPMLREIVQRLVAELRPCRIYVFGSKAGGDSGKDSDYDLLLLVERPADLESAAMERRAEQLPAFAWVFRYPGEHQGPSAEEAQEALVIAQRVYEAVLARLPGEVRP